ncbi:homeobox [Echinococcus multilocularis]|uniref:Homeobox n=1 Tax=Echinococcus multilocularis TaxID=6211 RepID=A0A087VY48_ECHMU|nr:homeobox [Echinococcus multilocularis]
MLLVHHTYMQGKFDVPSSQSPSSKRCSRIGRSPRVPFTRSQVEGLEAKFRLTNYLSSREVTVLANQLQVTETRVKIWFQNRRARQRREAFVREAEQTTQHLPRGDQLNSSAPQLITFTSNQTPQNPLSTDITFLERDLLQLTSTASRDAFTRPSYAMQELSNFYQQDFHEMWF